MLRKFSLRQKNGYLIKEKRVVFFPPFFKCDVVFQDKVEDYLSEDDINDMIEVIVF